MKKFVLLILIIHLVLSSGCAKVFFVSERDGRAQIYKMITSGEKQTNISNNTFKDHFPDVSFDGQKIEMCYLLLFTG
jgi:Tol biopolymer transport system component